MARRRKSKKQNEETLVDLVEAKEQASDYVNKNSTAIIAGVIAFVVAFGGYFAYKQFVKIPNEKNATEAMRFAQDQFERDSFALALQNPGGGNAGFLSIIEDYSGTKAANSALFYAGVAYMQLGQYDAAIDYIKEFSPKDDILPISKHGTLGDIYGEQEKYSEAISAYKKAIAAGENESLVTHYLKKLGMLYEHQGNLADSKAAFERIKNEFPTSLEGQNIDKYITRVAAKM